MDQESRDKWLSRSKWTGEEAIFLILDIDPEGEIAKHIERYYSFVYEIPPVQIREYEKVKEALMRAIAGESNAKAIGYEEDFPVFYCLEGEQVRNPFRKYSSLEVSFSPETFYIFAQKNIFSDEKLGANVPIFGLYHEREESVNLGSEVVQDLESIRIDGIEVIEGVTVADIHEMIESNRELGDVLQAVNQWRKLPSERKTPKALYCNLNVKAKKNGWGLDNTTDEITKKQYENIGDVFIQSSKKLVGGKEERIYPKWEDAIKEN